MRTIITRGFLCLLICLLCVSCALADEERDALFDAALEGLLSPAQQADLDGALDLHTGDSAYVPCIAPEITPYDERETIVYPPVTGPFSSSDESVVTVTDTGLMTGVAPGTATVTYQAAEGERAYQVTVSDDALPELIKNYIYVVNREFYTVKRARLPKYNQYAKWYYGRKNEVGWCSVFTIYCANAAGANPIKVNDLEEAGESPVQFFREGQVGRQYDGFLELDRFVSVPKPGYLVIYADMSNAYRTTHVGIVVDVVDRGDGIYAVTTVEGNMSNTVKSYCYLYDSNAANNTVGVEKGRKLQNNMSELPAQEQTDPLVQYELHTDHWSVFGFGASWL